ncbi:MAG: sigma-70 family RNA polymerase sigma factor, partial [Gaiellales bacterium]
MSIGSEASASSDPPCHDTFEALYAEHSQALRDRCRRLTRDPSAADDLMQEVFVRFLARFPEPPSGMNVSAYLYATARNIQWKQLRDEHEDLSVDVEQAIGPDDELERDPERAALLAEQRSLVQRCSALLSGRQRRALSLSEIEGHSYAEIGSELGIGVDAVGHILTRARARLRGALRRAQIDHEQLPAECRALLGPLADYVDGRQSTSSAELERHLAGCETCRGTLAAYQEAGSRLRGITPLAPVVAAVTRIAAIARGAGDGPASVGALASVTAAVFALGGGGVVLAHHLISPAAPAQVRLAARHHAVTSGGHASTGQRASGVLVRPTVIAPSPAGTAPGSGPTSSSGQLTTKIRSHPRHHRTAVPAVPAAAPSAVPNPGTAVPPTTTVTGTPGQATTPETPVQPPKTTPSTPGVTAPTVTVPPVDKVVGGLVDPLRGAIRTPTVHTPTIATPPVSTPPVTVPAVSVPPVTVPAITTPA